MQKKTKMYIDKQKDIDCGNFKQTVLSKDPGNKI